MRTETGVGAEPLRRAFLDGGASGTSACPPAEQLWAGASRSLGAEEFEALLDHLAACRSCAEAWRIAVDVQEDAPPHPLGAVVPFRPRRPWMPVAWATGLAASVVLIIQLAVPRAPAPPTLFDAGPLRGVQPGAPRALVDEGATLPREACVLRWTGSGQGAQYFVRVLDEQMQVVARGEWLDRPEFALPETALSRVGPGARLFWQVDARASDGTRASSPLYSFTVR